MSQTRFAAIGDVQASQEHDAHQVTGSSKSPVSHAHGRLQLSIFVLRASSHASLHRLKLQHSMLRGCNFRSTFRLCSVSLRQHGSKRVPCAHQCISTPTVRCSATSTVGSKHSSLEYTSQLQSEIDRLSNAPMVRDSGLCCGNQTTRVLQRSHPTQVPRSPSLVFVVSGPSGVGKDAAIKELQRVRPGLHFVVTATSRSALSIA